jgi:hypothetical protein
MMKLSYSPKWPWAETQQTPSQWPKFGLLLLHPCEAQVGLAANAHGPTTSPGRLTRPVVCQCRPVLAALPRPRPPSPLLRASCYNQRPASPWPLTFPRVRAMNQRGFYPQLGTEAKRKEPRIKFVSNRNELLKNLRFG